MVDLLTRICPRCGGAGQYIDADEGPFYCNCNDDGRVLTRLGIAVDWLRRQREQGLERFWIAHPACQGEQVGPRRWLAFQLSEWLDDRARRLERFALYDRWDDDDIPF